MKQDISLLPKDTNIAIGVSPFEKGGLRGILVLPSNVKSLLTSLFQREGFFQREPLDSTAEGGFTLLEVLVALVVLALAFSSAYLSLDSSARHLLSLQDKTAAEWVGLNVIAKAQLEVIPLPQERGNTNGMDKMFDANWYWVLNIYPTDNANVSRMTVDVSKERDSTRLIQVTGYLWKNQAS